MGFCFGETEKGFCWRGGFSLYKKGPFCKKFADVFKKARPSRVCGFPQRETLKLVDSFSAYYQMIQSKWFRTVSRNISDDLNFMDESSFWFRVQIVNPCVKVELPEGFVPYESIYRLVLRDERKLSDLESEFLCYRQ